MKGPLTSFSGMGTVSMFLRHGPLGGDPSASVASRNDPFLDFGMSRP